MLVDVELALVEHFASKLLLFLRCGRVEEMKEMHTRHRYYFEGHPMTAESSRLVYYNRRSTITRREIYTVVGLLLPDVLAKHAASEGAKAVTKYTGSK
ncbi:Histone H2B [Taenia crassiceps]|uniref:Histone H2B n=1 Tax=Taenia crassiceps TaxID=6207 RepID=A0ABR4QD95_9CEST